jgi:hypothetical protein
MSMQSMIQKGYKLFRRGDSIVVRDGDRVVDTLTLPKYRRLLAYYRIGVA